jgi:hypothetical protein
MAAVACSRRGGQTGTNHSCLPALVLSFVEMWATSLFATSRKLTNPTWKSSWHYPPLHAAPDMFRKDGETGFALNWMNMHEPGLLLHAGLPVRTHGLHEPPDCNPGSARSASQQHSYRKFLVLSRFSLMYTCRLYCHNCSKFCYIGQLTAI